MTASTDFDRLVASWLEADGPLDLRTDVVEDALSAAGTVAQRRRIGSLTLGASSWPSRRRSLRSMGMLRTVLVIVLVALVGTGAVFVGRELLRTPDRIPHELRGTLTTQATLLGLRAGPAPIALPDDRLFIAGDSRDGSLGEIVDLATGGSVPVPGNAVPFTPTGATQLPDGAILVVGVSGDRGVARIVDPAPAHVVAEVPMTVARRDPAIARLADGRVLVSGGTTTGDTPESLASAEIYDPATRSFVPTGPLAVARDRHAMTTLDDGRVLVVGGWTTGARSISVGAPPEQVVTSTLDVEIFDPTARRFERVGVLQPAPRPGFGRGSAAPVRLPDGRVLIFRTGSELCGRHGTEPIATELFDPATSTLSSGPTIPHDISSAAVLPDGRVLVTGHWGFQSCGIGNDQPVEDAWIGIHDPMTGATLESRDPRTGIASLAVDTDRAYLASVALPDGRVALISDGGLFGLGGGETVPQVVDVFE